MATKTPRCAPEPKAVTAPVTDPISRRIGTYAVIMTRLGAEPLPLCTGPKGLIAMGAIPLSQHARQISCRAPSADAAAVHVSPIISPHGTFAEQACLTQPCRDPRGPKPICRSVAAAIGIAELNPHSPACLDRRTAGLTDPARDRFCPCTANQFHASGIAAMSITIFLIGPCRVE